jgi:hypothetical protein
VKILRAVAVKLKTHKVPKNPTVGQAMLAIAVLGGYIKTARLPPGWQTLGQGLDILLTAELGWWLHAELSQM